MKRWIAGMVALLCLSSLAGCKSSPVVSLDPDLDSVLVVPGVSVRLSVKGITQTGKQADRSALDKLGLRWEYTAEGNAFSVDEQGVLTAIAPGTGSVWAVSADGTLTSSEIEVVIKD